MNRLTTEDIARVVRRDRQSEQWEYTSFHSGFDDLGSLNTFGKQGWELCGLLPATTGNTGLFLLKRLVRNPSVEQV